MKEISDKITYILRFHSHGMHRIDKLIYKGDSDSVLRIYHDKGVGALGNEHGAFEVMKMS